MNTKSESPNTYWDDAYDNSKSVGGSDRYVEAWEAKAAEFRERTTAEKRCKLNISYGEGEREKFDLFMPEHGDEPTGLVIFVHGGYWMRFGREHFSHLATGSTARGWAIAMPSYDLCPNIALPDIARQIAQATQAAIESCGNENKPLRIIGHSAGGHLVSRLVSYPYQANEASEADEKLTGSRLLPTHTLANIARVISVSGVHDLRPLLNISLNETLRITKTIASNESPALLEPPRNIPVTCWVGANELSEFKRQTSLLANIWKGFGIDVEAIAEPAKNHFDVIEGLADRASPLIAKLLG